ncbi:lipopolysaccharide biosynthesis protein [Phocaeicola faecicola]|uniref:lipopolysaccharide biosynthesis protein n=1 Tax=Phocaeicola faecicola TaxID=2739389 RepID=UPI0015E7512E|nr:lipopolysaccharide biosynthesis protein [Phocaeicola faecicola]
MADEQTLKEKTAKGLFWGALSNGMQQLLSLLFGICLARILSPDDYGLFNMLIVFTSLAALLQESGFIVALINKKKATDKDYNSVFWFSCSMGCLLYMAGYLAAPWIAEFYHAPELLWGARVMFIWFLFGCTCTVHNAIIIKKLMVKERAKADLTAYVLSCIIGVAMAWKGMGYWSLIVQMVVQGCVSCMMRWYYSPWRPSFQFSIEPLRTFFPFSIKLLLTGLFNILNNNIFSILIGRFYTKSQTGYYAQGYKWGYIAYSVIWGMVNNVSQPVLAQVADTPERQQQVFRKLVRFVAYVACPAMLGLAFVAPEFISVTVTDKWAHSIPYMQLFCLWGIITPINNLFTNAIISRGKSNIYMYGTVLLDVVQLLVIYLSAPYGLICMVSNYIVVNYCWFFVWFYVLSRQIPLRLKDLIFRDILPFALLTGAGIAVAYFATEGISNIYFRLLGKIGVVGVCYLALLYLSGSVMLQETLQHIRKIFHR